jgi:cytochrome c-type biogenesis protein CcmF
VLTGIGSAAVAFNRRLTTEVLPWTVPVLGGVATFFALLLVFVASPFATQVAPADGAGLNPSLQNPYMMIHPPLLYLGYVGLTIPFAFAAGALLSGRFDERWIVATRRWTILAWTALGIGILLGAKWAYEEVGWGGYYAWDPVENAALMPWLAATAYLHSVMVQEKKNMLRVWNATLVAGAFCLSIFGTFPDTERADQLDPLLRAVPDRRLVPRLHRARGDLLDRAHHLAAAAAAGADEAGVARLARGRLSSTTTCCSSPSR